MEKTLIVNREQCRELLTYDDCIGAMSETFSAISLEQTKMLQRSMIGHESGNTLAIMPASLLPKKITGSKIIIFPGKSAKLNKTNQGIVPLFDTDTGALRAIIDAELITTVRTASASACATAWLANKNAKSLAVLGAGNQGRAHALAIARVRQLETIYVWSYNDKSVNDFCEYIGARLPHVKLVPCKECKEAAENADIICTTTSAKSDSPILKGEWVKKGAHINAIGACSAAAREVDTECVKISRVFVDWKEAALRDGGDLAIPISKGELKEDIICSELGNVILGGQKGRIREEDITLFKSVGISVQDIAAAVLIYEKAKALKVGEYVEI